jgi:ABC-type glycerol-3-phosphate transport system substrate-binding protein
MRKTLVLLLVLLTQGLLFAAGTGEPAAAQQRQLVIWGEWAAEPNKLAYINRIVADFMKDNPSVKVTYTPYDGEQLGKTLQTMLVSGAGDLPDMAPCGIEWVRAGWFDRLNDFLDMSKFQPFVETDATMVIDGKPLGIFFFPVAVDYEFIGYNPEIFAKAGVKVPEDRTFTLDEFADVVKKVNQAGFSVMADGAGNRDYVGGLVSGPFLLSIAGPDAYLKLVLGEMDWNDSRARATLDYLARLRDAGLYSKNYLTMGIDEFHAFFHTKREAAMIMINTWYTGRAFKSQDEGGQDPNWHFQMLRYPVAKKGDQSYVLASVNGGPGILAKSKNKDIAADFIRYWQRPQYAAAWALGEIGDAAAVAPLEQGLKTRDLLKLVPGTEVDAIERCSGHNGTYGVKKEFRETSMKIGKPVFSKVRNAAPDYYASDCPMAGHQIESGLGADPKPPTHPLKLLRIAYGL